MTRALRASIWLRWRILSNTMRLKSHRDRLERLSRIMSVVAPVVIYVLFLGMAGVIGSLAFAGARLAAEGRINLLLLLLPARIVLIAVIIPLIVVPVGRSMQASGAFTTRMLLLPIPRGVLHLVDVVAGLFDPWMAFVPLSLLMIPAGFFSAGSFGAAIVALVAGLGMLACIACIGALGSALVQWLLRDRRRGEAFILVFMLGVIFVGFVPTFMIGPEERRRHQEERRTRDVTPMPDIEQFDARLPVASLVIPSELYGRAVRRSLEGRPAAGLACAAGLLAEAALLFSISARIHSRVLRTPAVQGRRKKTGRADRLPLVLPGLQGPVAAVALAQFRGFLRTVRGKLALLMTAPFVVVMAVALGRMQAEEVPFISSLAVQGEVFVLVALVMSMLSIQPLVFNQFASDRAGLTLQFLSPLSDVQLVASRALAAALLLAASALPGLAAAWLIIPGSSIWLWLAALASGCASFFLIIPLGILLSMLFPRSSDLSSIGGAGNAHPLAGFIGVITFLITVSVSWLVSWLGSGLAGSPMLAFLLAALWAALAAGIGAALMPLLAEALARRRENLALVAQGR